MAFDRQVGQRDDPEMPRFAGIATFALLPRPEDVEHADPGRCRRPVRLRHKPPARGAVRAGGTSVSTPAKPPSLPPDP